MLFTVVTMYAYVIMYIKMLSHFNDFVLAFIAFPQGCTTFRGEKPLRCLITLWMESGCIEDGEHFPSRAPPATTNTWNNRNLK